MRLLLVEDHAPLRATLVAGLRGEGHAIDATGSGEEAWWFLTSAAHDLVILDLMLPEIDGLTLLRRLRQRGSDTPVLILTAQDGIEQRIAGLDAGADDYLVKPFAIGELLARVRTLLRRRTGHRDALISIGDLAINTATHAVTRGERRIELTSREWQLLLHLALHRDAVIEREVLWRQLYDFNTVESSNVVEVLVGRLRRKLQAGEEAALLHTIRGHGYVLSERTP